MISGEFLAYFENGSTISISTDDYATVNVGSVALSATTTTPNANAANYIPGTASATFTEVSGWYRVFYTTRNFGAGGYVEITGYRENSVFSVNPPSLRFNASGGSQALTFSGTFTNLSSAVYADGITLSGNTVTAAANGNADARTGTIYFSANMADGSIQSLSVPVYQKGTQTETNAPFGATPQNHSFYSDSGSLAENFSRFTIQNATIGSNVFSVPSASWIHCRVNSTHTQEFPATWRLSSGVIYCDANTTGATRSGTIVLTDFLSGQTATLNVSQLATSKADDPNNTQGVSGTGTLNPGETARRGYVDFKTSKGGKIRVYINQKV